MRTTTWLALALALLAAPALAANPKLDEARRLVDDLEMDKAAKALDAATQVPDLSREDTLTILSLKGIVAATLGQGAKARDAFRELLVLNPTYELPADQPPRVRTPFYEAKDWAKKRGALASTAGAEQQPGLVASVWVKVDKDELKLARGVRFHLRRGGADRAVDVPLKSGRAETPVGAAEVAWWYEVTGERGRVLLEGASAQAPRQERATGTAVAATPDLKQPPADVPPPKETPVLAPTLPAEKRPEVAESAPSTHGWMWPTGWGLVGAGALAAGIGIIFGAQANASRATVLNAETNADGVITGLTQTEAAALEQKAQSQATVANALFITGGALAATGVVFVVVESVGGTRVAVAPAPGGLVARGSF
jgi:hypothetical protein